MMKGALAIFVKTAGHSPVKSRLAAERGERYAVDWYQRAAAAVASVARAAQAGRGLAVYWAVAEPDARAEWSGLPTLAQGEGGLGARMARVHAQLVARHGFGVLLGADAPQLTVAAIGEAASWLLPSSPRLVLGTATDGGFWLFGANIVPSRQAWMTVRYSVSDTARALQRAMLREGEWHILGPLTDVDHACDLAVVRQELQALPAPTAEQRALAGWMDEQRQSGPIQTLRG